MRSFLIREETVEVLFRKRRKKTKYDFLKKKDELKLEYNKFRV